MSLAGPYARTSAWARWARSRSTCCSACCFRCGTAPVRLWPHRRINLFALHRWTAYLAVGLILAHPARAAVFCIRRAFGLVDLLWPVHSYLQPKLNLAGAGALVPAGGGAGVVAAAHAHGSPGVAATAPAGLSRGCARLSAQHPDRPRSARRASGSPRRRQGFSRSRGLDPLRGHKRANLSEKTRLSAGFVNVSRVNAMLTSDARDRLNTP